jgi:hypothetical protein
VGTNTNKIILVLTSPWRSGGFQLNLKMIL